MTIPFDYQQKVWGTYVPSTSPSSLAGLRFYYFLKHISNNSGKLLEIGCGAGGNLVGVKRYCPQFSLYGCDIGKAAIAYGKKMFPELSLEKAPAEKLPYPQNLFDVVCFFDVLEHVEKPSLCIAEASRVLKPGGVFHAYVPCEGEILSLHGILNALGINLKKNTAGHIQKLHKKDLIKYCAQANLRVIESRWSCHLLNQIGDLGYYLFLTLTRRKLHQSLEGTFSQKRSFFTLIMSSITSLVSRVWYWESRLLWFWPGAGVHITAIKNS